MRNANATRREGWVEIKRKEGMYMKRKNRLQRWTSVFLAVCMAVSMAVPAYAAEPLPDGADTVVTAPAEPETGQPGTPQQNGADEAQPEDSEPEALPPEPAEDELPEEGGAADAVPPDMEVPPTEEPAEEPVEDAELQISFEDATDWSQIADIGWYSDSASEFEISTAQQLAGLAKMVNSGTNFDGKTVSLTADIDLSGKNWTPIGFDNGKNGATLVGAFCGVFDGGDFQITGLTSKITGPYAHAGLFARIARSATVRNVNLTVEAVEAVSTQYEAQAAGLVASIVNSGNVPAEGTIHDCHVIVNGYIHTKVDGGTSHVGAGAVWAVAWSGKIVDCTAEIRQNAEITEVGHQRTNTGALGGFISSDTEVRKCSVSVSGKLSSSQGNSERMDVYVGAILGMQEAGSTLVEDVYAVLEPTAVIEATGLANKTINCGAAAGFGAARGTVRNVHVINRGTGNIIAEQSTPQLVGGIVSGTLTNIYAYSPDETLGLCASGGKQTNVARIENAAAMKLQETYAGFDFANTWYMDSAFGYPVLGGEISLTDAQIVAAAKNNLTFDVIKGENVEQDAVSSKLNLMTHNALGADYIWSSSNTAVIENDGTVHLPLTATEVTLTATIRSGSQSAQVTIKVTVSGQDSFDGWIEIADTSWYNAADTAFTISTARQLAGLAKLVNQSNTFQGKTITLANDISLTGKNWTAIGTYTGSNATTGALFSGKFDGAGHTISGLNAEHTNQSGAGVAGLFGSITAYAELCNLNLIIANVHATGSTNGFSAGLAACATGGGTIPEAGNIHNCTVTFQNNGMMQTDSGTDHATAGGVVGVGWGKVLIRDCFVQIPAGAKIAVHSKSSRPNVGGLVGYAVNGAVIERCGVRNAGTISGQSDTANTTRYIGGLIGTVANGVVLRDSSFLMTATGVLESVGSTSDTAKDGIGGLGDVLLANSVAENCYVVNLGTGNIRTAHADTKPPLLFRNAAGQMKNVYAYSADSSHVLYVSSTGTFENCKKIASEAEMKQKETFKGFNFFDPWVMPVSGYPALGVEKTVPEAQVVSSLISELTFDAIKGENTDQNAVSADLDLPQRTSYGAEISWSSSAPDVIRPDGVVRLPNAAASVKLTANIRYGNTSSQTEITVKTAAASTATDWLSLADVTWYDAEASSYQIADERQLAGIAKLSLQGVKFAGKTITLTTDLDLSGRDWTPIGPPENGNGGGNAFAGKFDGGGHSILGLTVSTVGEGPRMAGLFACIMQKAEVCNLSLSVKEVRAESSNSVAAAAGLVAMVDRTKTDRPKQGNIHNCTVTVPNGAVIDAVTTAKSWCAAGAAFGTSWGAEINDCFVEVEQGGTISGSTPSIVNVGGYIGFVKDSTVRRCRVRIAGTVQANDGEGGVGGFLGRGSGVLEDCYTLIEPTGRMTKASGEETAVGIGGLVGQAADEALLVQNAYVINRGTLSFDQGDLQAYSLIGHISDINTSANNVYAYTTQTGLGLTPEHEKLTLNNVRVIANEADISKKETYQGFDFISTWVMDQTIGSPVIGAEVEMDDAAIVAYVVDSLSFDTIKGKNTAADQVKYDLVLPTEGFKGSKIIWSSDVPEVISAEGRVMPVDESTSREVILTATVISGSSRLTKTIKVTVVPGQNWNSFWRDYWNKTNEAVICTVGDSITSSNLTFTDGHKFYYEWIQERLNGEMGKHVTVVNPAIGGWKMNQFSDAAKEWVVDYDPDIVTVYFGMNDRSTATPDFNASFDSLMSQILPADKKDSRVVVLISCNPAGNGNEGNMRTMHAYGETLAQQYQADGYMVQYVDLYDYYKMQLLYGKNGNLASFGSYALSDGIHMNAPGNYATAQFLMKNMGLYAEDSKICNIPHDQVMAYETAPAASLVYAYASTDLNGTAPDGARADSPGFAAAAASNAYGSILMLGGAATEAGYMDPGTFRSYTWHLESYLRTVIGRTYRHGITVASGDYDVDWFNSNFDSLKSRFDNPSFILYMPEVNELYQDGYVHSADKVAAYGTALAAFTQKCKAAGIELTLMTPFPMADAVKDGYLREYVQKIIDVANANGLSLSNLYSVISRAAETSPQIKRNWYTEGGMPNHIAHVEAAKTFLSGTYGSLTGAMAGYTYRNGSKTSGTQMDRFPVESFAQGDRLKFDLASLLSDPMYSGAPAFTLRKTAADGTVSTLEAAYDAENKTLGIALTDVSDGDSLTLIVDNGATTYVPLGSEFYVMLSGAPAITGTAKYGETLTADVSAVEPAEARDTLTYAWHREGVTDPVGTASSYVLAADDIGKTITLTVTANLDGYAGSVTSAATEAVAKADGPAAPEAPTLASKTDTTVTLTAVDGQEYRMGEDGEWQSSAEFTGLTDGTAYAFFARVAETDTAEASEASKALAVVTYTYEISLDKTEPVELTAQEGYAGHSGAAVTVANTGTGSISDLAVEITGTNAESFTASALSTDTLEAEETATFTVNPVDSLAIGAYTATVTVTGSNGTSASFDVQLTVSERKGVTVSGSASFEAGMVPQIAALTGEDGLVIASDATSAVKGDYTLTRVADDTQGAHAVTFAVTKTGESKAAISVKLTGADEDLSTVGIVFKAAELTAMEFTFDLTGVPEGTYSVETYKKNHTTATMNAVAVGDTAVALEQTMKMLAGDLDSDGQVVVADYARLMDSYSAEDAEVDLNDDGYIDLRDYVCLMDAYNQQAKTYTFTK